MGIAASASAPPPTEPAGASAPPPSPTAEPIAASTPSTEAAAPPPPPTTEAADPPGKDGAAADAGADGDAETVVVDVAAEAGKEEEEEEGECGFCLFMKGGGCKEEFMAWEKCVEEAEADGKKEDVVERCHDATAALRKCMDAHADYYEPILRAERAMAEDLEAAGSEPAPSSSPEAPEPASTLEEDQKKQADGVADLDSKKGDPAA